jgi:hypothetical protein
VSGEKLCRALDGMLMLNLKKRESFETFFHLEVSVSSEGSIVVEMVATGLVLELFVDEVVLEEQPDNESMSITEKRNKYFLFI